MEARHCSTAPAGSAAWPQFLQTAFGLRQRLGFLAKGEAHLLRSILGILVEAGARNRRDANVLDEVIYKFRVVHIAEGGDVGHDVISSRRAVAVKAAVVKNSQQPVAPRRVVGGELLVVLRTEGDCRGGCLLQGRRRIDCQKVM